MTAPRDARPTRRQLAALLLVWVRVASGPAAGAAQSDPPESGQPVPDRQALQQADTLLAEVFRRSLASARTDRQKVEVAEKLVNQAAATRDAAEKYALLERARSMAVDVADFALAMDVVDRLAQTFDIDVLDRKRATLEALSHNDLSASQCRVLGEHAWRVIDACVAAGRYDVARDTGQLVVRRLRRVRDEQYLRVFVQRLHQIDAFEQQRTTVTAALEQLEGEPLNPQWNLVVGRYRCFVSGDWQRGLPMLALGNDPQLRELAIAELGGPGNLDARIELADQWWAWADTQQGRAAESGRLRAAQHYRDVLQQTSGLTRMRLERRVQKVQGQLTALAATSEPATRAEPVEGDRLRRDAARILEQAVDGLQPVCDLLWAGGAARHIDARAAAEPFQCPPDDGRSGANGLLLHAPRGWGGRGTVWSCRYQRKESAGGIQFIHPFHEGHVVVTISDQHLTVTSPGAWDRIGYGNPSGTSFPVHPVAGRQQPLRLTGGQPRRLTSILTKDGLYYFFLDDRLFAQGRVAYARPLKFSPDFTGLDHRRPLSSGRAGIVIGPVEQHGINRADQVRFGHARARRG